MNPMMVNDDGSGDENNLAFVPASGGDGASGVSGAPCHPPPTIYPKDILAMIVNDKVFGTLTSGLAKEELDNISLFSISEGFPPQAFAGSIDGIQHTPTKQGRYFIADEDMKDASKDFFENDFFDWYDEEEIQKQKRSPAVFFARWASTKFMAAPSSFVTALEEAGYTKQVVSSRVKALIGPKKSVSVRYLEHLEQKNKDLADRVRELEAAARSRTTESPGGDDKEESLHRVELLEQQNATLEREKKELQELANLRVADLYNESEPNLYDYLVEMGEVERLEVLRLRNLLAKERRNYERLETRLAQAEAETEPTDVQELRRSIEKLNENLLRSRQDAKDAEDAFDEAGYQLFLEQEKNGKLLAAQQERDEAYRQLEEKYRQLEEKFHQLDAKYRKVKGAKVAIRQRILDSVLADDEGDMDDTDEENDDFARPA